MGQPVKANLKKRDDSHMPIMSNKKYDKPKNIPSQEKLLGSIETSTGNNTTSAANQRRR
jgi:hypothetical protein